jgi:hypothetical protein
MPHAKFNMVLSNAMYETFENLMALCLLLEVFVEYIGCLKEPDWLRSVNPRHEAVAPNFHNEWRRKECH